MFIKKYCFGITLLMLLACTCIGYAKDFMGSSEYYIADLTTKDMAVKLVRDKAKKNALEQAGTFVTSYSESTNGLLTRDDVKVVTLGVARLKPNSESIKFTAPDENGAVTLSYSAVFSIDEKEVETNIKNYQINTKELKEARIKNENQHNFIKELSELYLELQKEYKSVIKDKKSYNESINNIREGLSATEYGEQADNYFKNLDFKNALIYYKKELEAYNKTRFTITDKNKIIAMQCIAMCYYGLHQNEQVVPILEEAYKLAREDYYKAKILAQLAKARLINGEKFDKVISLANQAVSLYPSDETYFERMDLYFTFKEWQKALEDYNRMSEEEKKSPGNAYIGAFCYAEIGDTDKALQLDELISENDRTFESIYGSLYTKYKYLWAYVRGKAFFMRYAKTRNLDDIDKALKEFTTYIDLALANDYYLAAIYYYRGVCYGEKGDYKSAYNDAMMALTINPNYEPAKLMIKLIEEKQMKQQR